MRPSSLRLSSVFAGATRTLAFLLFLSFVLLCSASTAQADPVIITGGTAGTPPGIGNFSLSPTGLNFSYSGANMGAPRTQLCGPCQAGSQFGGTVAAQISLSFGLTYNGVTYMQSGITQGYVVVSSGNFFTFPVVTIPDDYSPVSAPFTFVGGVSVNPINGAPAGATPFHLELSGSGIVTFTFIPTSFGNSRSQASFAFAPPAAAAPVPEPATMLLLGTGLAGLVGATRRRRGGRSAKLD